MNIELFSKRYKVRKLNESDIPDIYELCIDNPLYYKYCPPPVTKESIAGDLKALPPGKTSEDKYYIGFYDNNVLIAVMDLIKSFPDDETVLIGLFMMNKSVQRRGIGSRIINDLSEYLAETGVKYIRLGWIEGNKEAEAFWHKNKFKETGVTKDTGRYMVVIAQRELRG